MSYTVRVEQFGIDPMKVRAAMSATDEIMLKHMESGTEKAMQVIEGEWKRIAPVRTGEYRRNVRHTVVRVGNNVLGTVFNPLRKAEWIEYGTGIYHRGGARRGFIRPNPPKRALRWREGGRTVFARSVRGQRAQLVARRARVNTTEARSIVMRVAAAAAAAEIKAMM